VEYVDSKSGVSARLTISGYENLVSTAERRLLINGEKNTTARLTDFWGVVPAITGKVELVYEGEQEGPYLGGHRFDGQGLQKAFPGIISPTRTNCAKAAIATVRRDSCLV